MPLKKLFDGLWTFGQTKIVTRGSYEKMKSWTEDEAIAAGIPRTTFNRWAKNNFQEEPKLIIIDDPSIVENVPNIEAELGEKSYILKESEWKKLKPYFGLNNVFARLLHEKSIVSNSDSKIEVNTIDAWLKEHSIPIIISCTDYEYIFNKLTRTEDYETLMMSAGLGMLEGQGSFSKKNSNSNTWWRSTEEENALANVTGILPRTKGFLKDSINWIYLDIPYVQFLENHGFIEWNGNFGSFNLPKALPYCLYGKNKNAFLAQAIQPALDVSRHNHHSNKIGFQLRSLGKSTEYSDIIINLLEELNVLPSKAFVSNELFQSIGEKLKKKEVIVYQREYENKGVLFLYAPQGLLDPDFNIRSNAVRLKNFIEQVIPYAFHSETDYQDMYRFVERMNKYPPTREYPREKLIMLSEVIDSLKGINLPNLTKKDFMCAGKEYSFRMPVWYQS